MTTYLLAIDQGTTNSRAILFDEAGHLIKHYELALQQFYPRPGWVEQDPEEMFRNTLSCIQAVIKEAHISLNQIAGIGIANQRETTILWDRKTGRAVHPAIVWQDRRTEDICKNLSQTAISTYIRENTGLVMDPYFSATKLMWLLAQSSETRKRAERGELLFGTVDCYLLWRLTAGKVHATDITNASRTMLFNIKTLAWDKHILSTLEIPQSLLPTVLDNTAHFGDLDSQWLGQPIPIMGMAGDQQAAAIGQTCFQPGMVKSTYGTGCFMLLNTGSEIVQSRNQLLSTVAYRINKQVAYGLEGSIFSAGNTIKWLRDHLKIIKTAAESEELARGITDTGGVYLVPAFTGLGAPYWQASARAAILGLSAASGREVIVRAGLESVVYQTRDLLQAMTLDSKLHLMTLRVDGGMAANNWFLQFLADLLDLKVERPVCIETTALGVAYLAGISLGMYTCEALANRWEVQATFHPQLLASESESLYAGWKQAVKRVISN